MGLSMQQVVQIKDRLKEEYSGKPQGKYMSAYGIFSLRGTKFDEGKLSMGESLDDLCLVVYLEEEPPADLGFPSRYKDVRVFYE